MESGGPIVANRKGAQMHFSLSRTRGIKLKEGGEIF